nr:histone H1-like [Aedes albopictus]
MSEVAAEAAAAAPAASPAKAKKPRAPKGQGKPKKPSTHPPRNDMVVAAIKTLKERNGSSLQAIKKYIAANYKCDVAKLAPILKKALKNGVEKGKFVQTKGTGASGSFKLKAEAKKAAGEKKPKKAGEKKAKRLPERRRRQPRTSWRKKAKKPAGEKKAKKPAAAKKAKAAGAKAAKKAGGCEEGCCPEANGHQTFQDCCQEAEDPEAEEGRPSQESCRKEDRRQEVSDALYRQSPYCQTVSHYQISPFQGLPALILLKSCTEYPNG